MGMEGTECGALKVLQIICIYKAKDVFTGVLKGDDAAKLKRF